MRERLGKKIKDISLRRVGPTCQVRLGASKLRLLLELGIKLDPRKLGASPIEQSRDSKWGSLLEFLLYDLIFKFVWKN
jgi:hypothetical protein